MNLGDELLIIQANQANLLNCQSISLSSSFLSVIYWYIGVWSFALNLWLPILIVSFHLSTPLEFCLSLDPNRTDSVQTRSNHMQPAYYRFTAFSLWLSRCMTWRTRLRSNVPLDPSTQIPICDTHIETHSYARAYLRTHDDMFVTEAGRAAAHLWQMPASSRTSINAALMLWNILAARWSWSCLWKCLNFVEIFVVSFIGCVSLYGIAGIYPVLKVPRAT